MKHLILQSLQQSQQKHQDDIIALQAQLHKLEYEKTNLISERDMQVLQHEKDLREAQSRTDVEHRRYQEAESERLKAVRQVEAAVKEARDARDNGVNDRASLDRKLLQRLKQGRSPIDGRLDLHGMTQDDAHRALAAFLSQSAFAGRRLVLVITGKGQESQGRPGILRSMVPRWLVELPNRSLVGSWSIAHPRDGGGGALYVQLRRRRGDLY